MSPRPRRSTRCGRSAGTRWQHVEGLQRASRTGRIIEAGLAAIASVSIKGRVPELWDRRAAERIVDVLMGGEATN